MNIYIKDMNMPSNCIECKMSYEGSYCLLVEDDNEAILDGKMWRRCPLDKRPDWCPLFEDNAITTLPKNLPKIKNFPETYKSSIDGIHWEWRPNLEDIIKKVNEIINYLNTMPDLHKTQDSEN